MPPVWRRNNAGFHVRRARFHRGNTVFDAGKTPFFVVFLRIAVIMVF
jgi:hypothetical protein